MKVRTLTSALNDLARGRKFYERQGENLGAYFFDSVFVDIDSLALYGGIHRKVFGFISNSLPSFLTPFIIA